MRHIASSCTSYTHDCVFSNMWVTMQSGNETNDLQGRTSRSSDATSVWILQLLSLWSSHFHMLLHVQGHINTLCWCSASYINFWDTVMHLDWLLRTVASFEVQCSATEIQQPPALALKMNSESWCLENTYIQTICTVRCFLTNVFRWWKKHSEGICCWQGDWSCTFHSPSQSRYTLLSVGSVVWNATSLIYTVERMVTVKVSWASSCRVCSEADQWQPESGRKQHHCWYWYRPSCTVWYKTRCDGISSQRL